MLLEWIQELEKNSQEFERVFGVTTETFKSLNSKYAAQTLNKKSIEAEHIFPLVVLCNRFALNVNEINSIFLPNSAKRTVETLLADAKARLKEILESDKTLTARCKSMLTKAVVAIHSEVECRNLKSLQTRIRLVTNRSRLVTRKVRVPNIQWTNQYLSKHPRNKRKTADANFLQILSCCMQDFSLGKTDPDKCALYLAAVLHSHETLSSYIPAPGYGKARKVSKGSVNKYARTQADHALNLAYEALTKTGSGSGVCILRTNDSLKKMIQKSVDNTKFADISLFNEWGYVDEKKKKKPKNMFNTVVGHSGVRLNTHQNIFTAIKYKLNDEHPSGWISKLRQCGAISSSTSSFLECTPDDVLNHRLAEIEKLFEDLNIKSSSIVFQDKLASRLYQYRIDALNLIKDRLDKIELSSLKVYFNKNSTCMTVAFYPGTELPQNANYTEGVTNVIIGIFGGLVNHLCDKYGLNYNIQRRPSFGFNRTTLTDVGHMKMRVSIGLEGPTLALMLTQALKLLDDVLAEFDFTDPKDKRLADGFEVVENPRRGVITENTGIAFLKATRSDINIINTVKHVHSQLNSASNHEGKSNYVHDAIQEYINDLVAENLTATETPIQTDHVIDIKNQKVNGLEDRRVTRQHLLITLLSNCLREGVQAGLNSKAILVKDNRFHRSYYIALVKLYKNCHKAAVLIERHHEFSESIFYIKAILIAENIIEYLLLLDSLSYVSTVDPSATTDMIDQWRASEQQYYVDNTTIPATRLSVYFTAGGEQALVTSLFLLQQQTEQTRLQNKNVQDTIFLSPSVYYELDLFLTNDLKLATTRRSSIKSCIAIIDIQDVDDYLNNLNKISNELLPDNFILDITHAPFSSQETLKKFSLWSQEKNKCFVLVSSMLKHEQLGMDRFQLGKMVFYTPPKLDLSNNIIDEIKSIERDAIHPSMASFQCLINRITGEKSIKKLPAATLKL
jgi:hypothetical protein